MEILDKAFHLLCSTFPVTLSARNAPQSCSQPESCRSSQPVLPEGGRARVCPSGEGCGGGGPLSGPMGQHGERARGHEF